MEWVIHTQDLTKSYGQVEALKSLDLRVARNSIFGFLGPNGAGKTTAIKLLLGLIRPTAFRVRPTIAHGILSRPGDCVALDADRPAGQQFVPVGVRRSDDRRTATFLSAAGDNPWRFAALCGHRPVDL